VERRGGGLKEGHHLMKSAKILLPSLLCLHLIASGQTAQVINDNLQVTGTLDVEGNVSSFGTIPSSLAPGLNQTFTPVGTPTTTSATVSWENNLSMANFAWRRLNNAGTASQDGLTLQLHRTAGSTLTLLGSDLNATPLTLSAGYSSSISTIPGVLKVLGNSFTSMAPTNTLPNQTLNSTSSILTRSLGDGRYLMRSEGQTIPTLIFGAGSSAVQSGSIALGVNAIANGGTQSPSIALGKNVTTTATTDGQGSIAIGWNAQAGGADRPNSVAIGAFTKSTGFWSLAMGYQAEASWWHSVAIGYGSKATDGYAQAIGWGSLASGYCSTSLGMHTLANSYGLTALGVANAINPNASVYSASGDQDLLVVGNGDPQTWPTQRSNAFTLKWNGDGWIQGNFTTAKGLNVTEDAAISGDASIQGDLEAGKASFTDTVRIAPRGGISMGEFTYDPEAPPAGN
jgi:hypothetical protein